MSLLGELIDQAQHPNGILGRIMIGIMNNAHGQMTKWGLSHLTMRKDAVYLDIGCGGGRTIEMIAKKSQSNSIHGIDSSQTCVDATIKKNMRYVEEGSLIVKQANVSDMPYKNEQFDYITAVQTHYFWSTIKSDMKEIHRLLKTKGSLMILSETSKMTYHMDDYNTQEKLRDLLEQEDFNQVRLYQKNGWMCMVAVK